jgi:hypothetical protein
MWSDLTSKADANAVPGASPFGTTDRRWHRQGPRAGVQLNTRLRLAT